MMRCAAILVALTTSALFAQVNEWPVQLSIPMPEEAGDSAGVGAQTSQNLFEKTLRSRDLVYLTRNDSARYFEQQAQYDLTYDHGTPRNFRDQYLNLDGALWSKRLFLRSCQAGLTWSPALRLKTRQDTLGVFQGDLDVGPSILVHPLGVSIRVNGGLSTRLWNSEVAEHLGQTPQADFSSRTGFFVGAELANAYRMLGGTAAFASGEAYARALGEQTRLAGTLASLRIVKGFPTKDSFFVAVADSFLDGDNAQLSEGVSGKSGFTDEPSIVEHALAVTGGIRGTPRAHVVPGLAYAFSVHSKKYPWDPSILDDVKRRTTNALQVLLRTEEGFLFDYSGGIRFSWEFEDWLYDRTPDTLAEYSKNTNDVRTFRAEMVHRVSKLFPNGVGAAYAYAVSRNSRTYPVHDTARVDGVQRVFQNTGDHDEIIQRHDAQVMFYVSPRCSLDVFGGGASHLSHYLRGERSLSNMKNRMYKVGARACVYPLTRLRVDQTFGGKVEVGEYEYASYHADPSDPPPYSRQFYSRLNLECRLAPRVALKSSWNEMYDDDGYWDSRSYRDSAYLDSVGSSYRASYRIQSKTWDHRVSLSVVVRPVAELSVEVGTEARDVYAREFDDVKRAYVTMPYDEGDGLIPFIAVSDAGEGSPWSVEGRVAARIDVNRSYILRDPLGKGASLSYWDVRLLVNLRF